MFAAREADAGEEEGDAGEEEAGFLVGEEGEDSGCREGGEKPEGGTGGGYEKGDGGEDEEREVYEDVLVKRVGAVEGEV